MCSDSMLSFLSRDNCVLHSSYLEKARLKYSILEKSFEELKGKCAKDILNMRLPRELKAEALHLLSEIESHELFFASFAERNNKCELIRKYYSSEESFLYEIYEKALKAFGDFLYICLDTRGKPTIATNSKLFELYPRLEPKLCLDLCEHSYFMDYGFEREEYLRAAISHLDLIKLLNT